MVKRKRCSNQCPPMKRWHFFDGWIVVTHPLSLTFDPTSNWKTQHPSMKQYENPWKTKHHVLVRLVSEFHHYFNRDKLIQKEVYHSFQRWQGLPGKIYEALTARQFFFRVVFLYGFATKVLPSKAVIKGPPGCGSCGLGVGREFLLGCATQKITIIEGLSTTGYIRYIGNRTTI